MYEWIKKYTERRGKFILISIFVFVFAGFLFTHALKGSKVENRETSVRATVKKSVLASSDSVEVCEEQWETDSKDNAASSAQGETGNQTEVQEQTEPEDDVLEQTEVQSEQHAAQTSPYQNMAISIAPSYVKVYQKPDTSGKLLGKLYGGSSARILKLDGEWVKIKSGKVKGYAKTDNLAIGAAAESAAEVSGQYYATVKKGKGKANVYADAAKKSTVLKKVRPGSKWRVTGEDGDFTEIQTDGGKTGYIETNRIRMDLQFEKAISIKEEKEQKAKVKKLQEEAALIAERQRENLPVYSTYERSGYEGNTLQQSIVTYALQFVGNPYVWGGESLTNGCDCSGFVMKIYESYGYSLPHYSASQAGCGTPIPLTSLEPGDLVFYRHGGRIGHVAMYIGNGEIVHAKSQKDGIVVTSVNYATPYCAVRIVNE